MCTLTYIPTSTGFVISSSRDELNTRSTQPPAKYLHKQQTLIYPKDLQAGGTWIAANQHGSLVCLLNGAFEHYVPFKKYPKSRGQVVLNRFDYDHPLDFWENISLEDTESFTLVCIEPLPTNQIFEFIWDEKSKYSRPIPSEQPFIRSSATLYDKASQVERKQWFQEWIHRHREIEDKNIIKFHNHPQDHDQESSIAILRSNGLQTVSLSQFIVQGKQKQFNPKYALEIRSEG